MTPLWGLMAEFNSPSELLAATRAAYGQGYRRMDAYSELLGKAIRSMVELKEEKDIDSLFSGGKTSALVNTISGLDDFELIEFIVFYDASATDGGTTRHLIETMLKKRGVKVTSQLIYEIMEREGI